MIERVREKAIRKKLTSHPTIASVLLLFVAVVLFYWKILLTHQFSLLTDSESVNQAYSWFHFLAANLRSGVFPLWDPYMFAGRSFAGEMQTGAFYPLNWLLALVPFNRQGMLSPHLYHIYYVFGHFLAACFMFALVRGLGLSRFSALIAGLCFSLGGFVARMGGWPHMLESCIWLPLIFLLLLRALNAESTRGALVRASGAGLLVGMSILAGGLHVVIMQAIVVVSAAVFYGSHRTNRGPAAGERQWRRAALVVAAIAIVGFAAGAVQLLPSMEYSAHALRFLGGPAPAIPATEKIPYAYLRDGLSANSILTFLFPGFSGNVGSGEFSNPYIGIFPLMLAVAGIWKCWANLWVRYAAGLAAAAFLFSLGGFSFLHGILYALVPYLWMAREPGRYIFLSDFGLILLAAFGAETLFSNAAVPGSWSGMIRILKWVAIAYAAAFAVPALFGHPEIGPWISLSIILFFAAFLLFLYASKGHVGATVRFLVIGLILFDLNAFDWTAANKIEVARTGTNYLQRMISFEGVAAFLKSRPGQFRTEVQANPIPNIGDIYGLETTTGGGVTLLINYSELMHSSPRANDLLNVKYFVKPATVNDPGAVYNDANWKVYENSAAFPRAWIVHESAVERSRDKLLHELSSPATQLDRVALVSEPLAEALEPQSQSAQELAAVEQHGTNGLQIKVHTQSRALLVTSEIFYPGWHATVNGQAARIYEVDGALRGVVVPKGESAVIFHYAPRPVFFGAALTALAFFGVGIAALLNRKRS